MGCSVVVTPNRVANCQEAPIRIVATQARMPAKMFGWALSGMGHTCAFIEGGVLPVLPNGERSQGLSLMRGIPVDVWQVRHNPMWIVVGVVKKIALQVDCEVDCA